MEKWPNLNLSDPVRGVGGGLRGGRSRTKRIKGLEEEVTPGVGGQRAQSSLQRHRRDWGPGAAGIRAKGE